MPERPAYASQPLFNFANIIENQQAIYHRPPFFNTIATGACAATHPWLGSEHSADPRSLAPLRGHPQDVAFNPSTFGEPLDFVFCLQEHTYPTQRVPIVLLFLAHGVLALGGEGVDDPLVPASLFKLWLRELVDPLVPSEMDNNYIAFAGDAEACCAALFLDERVLAATKMTSANLALVIAPNLLRCGSDSMAVVFDNAQYEQAVVHNLLNCGEIDAQYVLQHGPGAVPSAAPRASKSRNRRTLLTVARFALL
ncbi:hypothetical protein EDB86DRAFT_3078047 [Lactarius hatsudake]|nr:hypothetical protein EDB86DRAFT_3078047 [Lactarius hatsudake]